MACERCGAFRHPGQPPLLDSPTDGTVGTTLELVEPPHTPEQCVENLRVDRDCAWIHLAAISGALCDAGDVGIGDVTTYAEAIRKLTEQRDQARRGLAEVAGAVLDVELVRAVQRLVQAAEVVAGEYEAQAGDRTRQYRQLGAALDDRAFSRLPQPGMVERRR